MKNQAGGPVAGASVTLEESEYDMSPEENGKYLGANTVFSGTTNSTGIAGWIPLTLYTLYGLLEIDPGPPPSITWAMKNQTHGDWNTTGEIHGISQTIHNVTGINPIDMDTRNIVITLMLRPDFVGKSVNFYPGEPIAGDSILIWGTISNDGTMDAYCNISFYNDTIDKEHMFGYLNVSITAGKSLRTDTIKSIYWNTTEDMGETTHTIYMVVTDVSGYEEVTGNNNKTTVIFLNRPSPDINIAISFDNDAPMDGEDVLITANLTNDGRANSTTIDVSFWYGDPFNGGWQIGANQTVYDMSRDSTGLNHSVNVSETWNTYNMGNDSADNSTWDQNFITHDIYVWVEYNNAMHPDPLNTTNETESAPIDVYKFYNVSFYPSDQFSYINEEVPYTIYTYYVKNIGRAVDNITFSFVVWSSNMSNTGNWSYELYNDTMTNGQMFLHPGEIAEVYLNVSANWSGVNQGELFTVNVTAISTNDTSKKMTVKASTSAGTVDYTPTEIVFRRADGKRANNKGAAPATNISLVVNETSSLTVHIKNMGTAGSVFSFNVTFYVDEAGSWIPIGSTTFSDYIPANFFGDASINYEFTTWGRKWIRVYVDSLDDIGELDETNNNFTTYIYVKNRSAAYDFTFSGIVFDWDGQTPLEGATVKLTNQNTGYINTTTSDSNGKYTLMMPKDSYSDFDPIFIKATHPPDPAEDSKTLYVYSEDLEMRNVDFYLFVYGVDLTIRPHQGYNISFIRADGKYTNQPIVGENTTIRFWVVNRGTQGTNGTFQITKNGTSSVNLIGDPDITKQYYPSQSVTRVDWVYKFSDVETVDFDINLVDKDGIEAYTVNNMGRRTGVKIKSKLTNDPYNLTGTVYERASGAENVVARDANVTITNVRTNYSHTVTTDDLGRFGFDLQNLPKGYQEGDFIRVRAWKGEKEGIKEFYAYSEDRGKDLIIVFATYDVRVTASDVRQEKGPGEWTTYEIIIFNTGNVDDRFRLSLSGDHLDWGSLNINSISIEAGKSANVTLRVDVPSDYSEAVAGTVAHIAVTATSNNGNGPSDSVDTYTMVTQIYALAISADSTSGHALPGETVGYTITVRNNGNGDDMVQLVKIGTHNSWGEFDLSSFVISLGDSRDVTLTVAIPDLTEAGDDAIFNVSAISEGGLSFPTPEITTSVDEFFELDLSVGSPTKYGDPDTSVEYTITVYNKGNSDQDVKFDITGGGNARIIEPQPVLVGAFDSTIVTLEVFIPDKAKAYVVYTNIVEGSLSDHPSEVSNPVSINTVVNERFNRPYISVIGNTSKSIRPSTSVNFILRVVNNANADDTFSFSVSNSNPDFFYSIPSVAIASGDSADIGVVVTAPANAIYMDNATLEIQAVSSKGLKSTSIVTVIVTISEFVYGVKLDVDETNKIVNLGESVSYVVRVRNTGDYQNYSEQVSLRITNLDPDNADWTINVPNTVFLAKGEESVETSVFILVPSTTNTLRISFNILASVNLPKHLEDPEYASQYRDVGDELVTTVNQKPDAVIELPPGPYYYREDLQFSASGSSDPDPDGEVVSYHWDFGDGATEDYQNPKHGYFFPGTYQVSLTVGDNLGESHTAIKTIKVENKKPTLVVTTANTVYSKGYVEFTVNAADEEPNRLDYTWYFGDGSVATISHQNTARHPYTRSGIFTITCVALDIFGGSGSNFTMITIENNAPVPKFTVTYKGDTYSFDEDTMLKITEGDEVFFDAHASTDMDKPYGDRIISFNWIFGDGANGSGVQPTHIYKDPYGKGYVITLTVMDSEGSPSTVKGTLVIIVEEEEPGTPAYVYGILAVIIVVLIFFGAMYVLTPRRFFGAISKKGTASAEIAVLIDKLNDLEDKLKKGAPAAAAAPGTKFCSECDASNDIDAEYCDKCGGVLD
ncbi:MAG: PKD domain-containing protein [Thermoplasmata archaeon]|nr:PKD domain-containing protein [Thermoplasmata archaeon]